MLRGYEARARALDAGAAVLESEAFMMRRDAKNLLARAAYKKVEKARREIWREVASLIDGGLSEARAIASVAASMMQSEEHVKYWVEWAKKNKAAFAKWARDREIMRLAALGYTNNEIINNTTVKRHNGGKVLHEKSISRIISKKIGRK